MKKIRNNAFIIAEYNPFHNGHKFHIEKTRELGAENIICVMNGNFMQRGEPALCSKTFRAGCAVKNGADLVIELPVKYGVSSANFFAYGGVSAALCTGLDGTLSFGASADAGQLADIAKITENNTFINRVSDYSESSGKNYPSALREKLHEYNSGYDGIMSDANNILAVEYIKAIDKLNACLGWEPVKRSFLYGHDSDTPSDGIASAKYIRELIINGNILSSGEYLPENVFAEIRNEFSNGLCTENRRLFSNSCMSVLMNMSKKDFTEINGVSQGLENRITEGVKYSSSLEYLYDYVKTKRFTHSRIRQIILSAVLNIKRDDLYSGISYLRVLAFNEKGRALLKKMRDTATVPVITNISDISDKFSRNALRDRELDIKAGKLYELCRTVPRELNPEFNVKPINK